MSYKLFVGVGGIGNSDKNRVVLPKNKDKPEVLIIETEQASSKKDSQEGNDKA